MNKLTKFKFILNCNDDLGQSITTVKKLKRTINRDYPSLI